MPTIFFRAHLPFKPGPSSLCTGTILYRKAHGFQYWDNIVSVKDFHIHTRIKPLALATVQVQVLYSSGHGH
jgi:hypothetical protein